MGEVSQTHNDFEGVCRTLLLADQNSPTCDDSLVVGCRLFEHSVLSVLTTLPGNRDPSRSKMPCCVLLPGQRPGIVFVKTVFGAYEVFDSAQGHVDPWVVSLVCQTMFALRDNSGSTASCLIESDLHATILRSRFGRWQCWSLLCWPASLHC